MDSEIANNLRSLLSAAQAAELRHSEARDARRAAWAAVRSTGSVVLQSWEQFAGESAREDDLAVVMAVVAALRADKAVAASRSERDAAANQLLDAWWDLADEARADLPDDIDDAIRNIDADFMAEMIDDAISVPS
jgi:hypothetical protein